MYQRKIVRKIKGEGREKEASINDELQLQLLATAEDMLSSVDDWLLIQGERKTGNKEKGMKINEKN